MSASKTTTDHEEIRKWVEARNGKPAIVKGTENNDEGAGLLRIIFEEGSEKNLKEISWDEFFETFDQRDLSFLYQDKVEEGKTSRFFKFVKKEPAETH